MFYSTIYMYMYDVSFCEYVFVHLFCNVEHQIKISVVNYLSVKHGFILVQLYCQEVLDWLVYRT